MPKDGGCELCLEERITPWLYEDDKFFVAMCVSCDLPMVVLRDHRVELTPQEIDSMRAALVNAAKGYFGDVPFFVDELMRQIPDHKHMHARRRPQVPTF